jgi:hypothetical protein
MYPLPDDRFHVARKAAAEQAAGAVEISRPFSVVDVDKGRAGNGRACRLNDVCFIAGEEPAIKNAFDNEEGQADTYGYGAKAAPGSKNGQSELENDGTGR